MNTWTAFAMGEANRGKELMILIGTKLRGLSEKENQNVRVLVSGEIGSIPVERFMSLESR